MHITGILGKLKKGSMIMKNIVILGSNGMLGYAVTEYFLRKGYDVTALTRKDYDIAKDPINKLETFVKQAEVVINCAGVIKSVINNSSIEDILQVNSIFPRNLATLCNKHGVKCFHITTDCVYSGRKGNYDENDYFDADDVYGISKNAGDIKDCMTLRTSIIGEEVKGQSRSLLEWARSQAGKSVNGFTNHLWNGVTTVYLAEIIENILNSNLYQKGIFHVFSPNSVNKYELLQSINDVYNLKLKINPYKAESGINRTLNSVNDLAEKLVTKEIGHQISEMNLFFNKSYKL